MWTLADNMNGSNTSASSLFDMIHVSVLNFRADEFMETVVDARYDDDILTVRDIIEDVFKSIDLATVGPQNRLEARRGQSFRAAAVTLTTYSPLPPMVSPPLRKFKSRIPSSSPRETLNPASDATLVLQSTQNGHNPALPTSRASISQSLRHFISYITGLATTACVSPLRPPSSLPGVSKKESLTIPRYYQLCHRASSHQLFKVVASRWSLQMLQSLCSF
ncbi:hypothetical protein MMC08_000342 [Hypocenomyce scalaris]|nr:hypothetical protein [Hypocenomyce scalaris]